MAHQIVATSVPRGLDGVSGYQTVLKSKDIPPRVFDRLKARAGYSHPYSHGDPRNPVVYLHRIEELAGARWHVLGCIRDAGSDHTGRSNFLAHMLGVEAGEASGKLGGPAAAAMAGGCFLTKWDGPPDGSASPKTIVAGDSPPTAGHLPAWKAAGLDPGLAGDLAAAAMRSDRVMLITRPNDDVLALFADAIRLVEPSKRWSVTFNTCAMEDFDGTWKAIRKDLVDAGQIGTGKAVVIDLTAGARGSENPYARFARGDTTSLPWQKSSRAAEVSHAGLGDAPPRELDAQPGRRRDNSEARRAPLPTPVSGSSHVRPRVRRPRYTEKVQPRVPWHAITITGLVILIGGLLAAASFREQLFGPFQHAAPRASALDPPVADQLNLPSPLRTVTRGQQSAPTFTEHASADASLREASDRLATTRAEIMQQLENGTYGSVRTQASDLQAKVDTLRSSYASEWQMLVTINGQHQDPAPDIKKLLNAFNSLNDVLSDIDKVLGSRIIASLDDFAEKQAALTAATESLTVAAAGLDGLQANVRVLEASLRTQRKETRQEQAFSAFQTLSKTVALPAAEWQQSTDIGGLAGTTSESNEIDLGPFLIADLVDPQVRLAVPRDLDKGDRIELTKIADEPSACWEIRYLVGAVGIETASQTPRVLATLFARDGRLILKPAVVERKLSSLLRRSIILLETRQPDSPDSPPARHVIRLVEPMRVVPLVIDPFNPGRQLLPLPSPPGISRHVSNDDGGTLQLRLPIDGIRLEAFLDRGGESRLAEWRHNFTEDEQTAGVGGSWKTKATLFDARPNRDFVIQADLEVSLPSAVLELRTEHYGVYAAQFGSSDNERKENIKRFFIEDPKNAYALIQTRFNRAVESVLNQKNPGYIKNWFNSPVAVPANSGMDLGDHSPIDKSFSGFIAEQYNGDRGKPKDFEEFLARAAKSQNDEKWDEHFRTPVKDWATWFWAKYEAEWRRAEKFFQGALTDQYELRVTRVVSLAYDENGEEYEVPLVILDESASPAESGNSRDGGTAIGFE